MRFESGKTVDEDVLADTFSDKTEYDAGEIRFVSLAEMPDALR